MNTTSLSCQPKFNHVGFARGSRPVPVLEQITAEDGSRLYATPDGNRYPSVTTILADQGKEAIDAWRARVGVDEAKRISLRATTRGTRLHSYAEHYLNNVSDFLDANDLISKELFHSFQPILEPINNIHCQETRLYSHYLKLAGTVDCIGEYNGRLSIIDFKTASKPKQKDWIKSYFMQCAAYAIMYEEMTGIPVPQLVVLIAVEDSEPQIFIEKRNDWAKPLIEVRKRFGGY